MNKATVVAVLVWWLYQLIFISAFSQENLMNVVNGKGKKDKVRRKGYTLPGESVGSIPLDPEEIFSTAIGNHRVDTLGSTSPSISPAQSPTAAPTVTPPPPCIWNESQIAYVNGLISSTQTFYACLANVADPMNIPTYYGGQFNGIMNIYTNIQLNNLHQIDAVAGTATLDFYLRLWWKDDRLAMPLFWEKMDKTVQQNGFELTLILQENSSIGFWSPDVFFHDATDLNYISQTIRINASNIVFWSRHTVATYMEPKFYFDQYPSDTQIVNIRYGSYAYSQKYLKMVFINPGITFNTNYDNSTTYTSNPVWTYDNSSTYYETYVSGGGFLNVIYHIYMERQGAGIVVRLILPITLLLFLGGLTFWAEYSGRVDSTITLLLAVSALYIVILGNIPLVGYLTAIDRYVFYMFLMLIFAVILHQTYATIYEKAEQWPLRVFYLRLLETAGRCSIFPTVTGVFLMSLTNLTTATVYGMIIIVVVVTLGIMVREYYGLKAAFLESITNLTDKINNNEVKVSDLSPMELGFFNLWRYHTLSTSPMFVAQELMDKGTIIIQEKYEAKLVNLVALNNLLSHGANKMKVNADKKGHGAMIEGIALSTFKTEMMTENPMRNKESKGGDEEENLPRPSSARVIPARKKGTRRDAGEEEEDERKDSFRRSVSDYPDSDDEHD